MTDGAPTIAEPLTGPLGHRVRQERTAILRAAAEYGVGHPRVVGSVARGDERPGSDLDLVVDVPPGVSLFRLARLQRALEALLHADVDLIPSRGVKPRVRRAFDTDEVAL